MLIPRPVRWGSHRLEYSLLGNHQCAAFSVLTLRWRVGVTRPSLDIISAVPIRSEQGGLGSYTVLMTILFSRILNIISGGDKKLPMGKTSGVLFVSGDTIERENEGERVMERERPSSQGR